MIYASLYCDTFDMMHWYSWSLYGPILNLLWLFFKAQTSDDDEDGMKMDCEVLNLRFSEDLRINEVRKLLRSTQPVRIALTQLPEVR